MKEETKGQTHYMSFLVQGADINALQQMIDDFSVLTGYCIILLDRRGFVILKSRGCDTDLKEWDSLAIKAIEKEPERENLVRELRNSRDPVVKPCGQGLNYIADVVRLKEDVFGMLMLCPFRLLTGKRDEAAAKDRIQGMDAGRAKELIRLLTTTFGHGLSEHIQHIERMKAGGEKSTGNETTKSWMMDSEPVSEVSAMDALIWLEQAQIALKASEERYRTLVGNVLAIVYRCEISPPWYMFYISEHVRTITGYEPEDFYRGGTITYAEIVYPDDLQLVVDAIQNALKDESHYAIEYRIIDKGGFLHWVFERGHFYLDANKNPLYLDGVIMDITPMHEMHDQLQRALDEKEVLIREVHHRVKNNLQAMIHLIGNQMERVTDESAKMGFLMLKNQAYTMALLYDQLNSTSPLSKIEMCRYIEELTVNIGSAFQRPDAIIVTVECEQIWMDVSVAMPCALILNELITNAHKYAFPAGMAGEHRLLIRLTRGGDEYYLRVQDNGIGLPSDADLQKRVGSGLVLVRLWAEHQLGGTMKIYSDHGLTTDITFTQKRKLQK